MIGTRCFKFPTQALQYCSQISLAISYVLIFGVLFNICLMSIKLQNPKVHSVTYTRNTPSKLIFFYLESYVGHSLSLRPLGIGDLGGQGPVKLSLKAKSLNVGLGSLTLANLGTIKGLYLGFSFTGGGGPLFLSTRGDFGTIFGTFFGTFLSAIFGGNIGTTTAAFEGLSLRQLSLFCVCFLELAEIRILLLVVLSFLSVRGDVVKLLCSLRLRSEVSLSLVFTSHLTIFTLSYICWDPAGSLLPFCCCPSFPLEQATEQ